MSLISLVILIALTSSFLQLADKLDKAIQAAGRVEPLQVMVQVGVKQLTRGLQKL